MLIVTTYFFYSHIYEIYEPIFQNLLVGCLTEKSVTAVSSAKFVRWLHKHWEDVLVEETFSQPEVSHRPPVSLKSKNVYFENMWNMLLKYRILIKKNIQKFVNLYFFHSLVSMNEKI